MDDVISTRLLDMKSHSNQQERLIKVLKAHPTIPDLFNYLFIGSAITSNLPMFWNGYSHFDKTLYNLNQALAKECEKRIKQVGLARYFTVMSDYNGLAVIQKGLHGWSNSMIHYEAIVDTMNILDLYNMIAKHKVIPYYWKYRISFKYPIQHNYYFKWNTQHLKDYKLVKKYDSFTYPRLTGKARWKAIKMMHSYYYQRTGTNISWLKLWITHSMFNLPPILQEYELENKHIKSDVKNYLDEVIRPLVNKQIIEDYQIARLLYNQVFHKDIGKLDFDIKYHEDRYNLDF